MTPFVLAAAGLIVAVVMVIVSKKFRYIMLSASVALVICLVAFPSARLCAGQAATSIVSKFVSTSDPGAGAVPDSGLSALADEVDADQDDADDDEVEADDDGSVSDSQERTSLIVGAYGGGAGGALVGLLAAQDCSPVQKLVSIIKIASGALISPAAADEDTTESEPGMD
jgi:hypothetical protein